MEEIHPLGIWGHPILFPKQMRTTMNEFEIFFEPRLNSYSFVLFH